MNRKLVIISGAAAIILGGAAWLAWQKRETLKAAVPSWLNPEQPPDSIAPDLLTVSDAESWAANRCRHITGACRGQTAGARVRRTYPESLAAADYSLVRLSFEGGV